MWDSLRALTGLQVDTVASPAEKPANIDILGQSSFSRMLSVERKRSERSHRRFVLMLLKSTSLLGSGAPAGTADCIIEALSLSMRQTDILGWYERGSTLGVIFTEIGDLPEKYITETLVKKTKKALNEAVNLGQNEDLTLTFHLYPEGMDGQDPAPPVDSTLFPDFVQHAAANKLGFGMKRAIDIVASLFGLVLCLPVFIAVALVIKATSKGPILFRQKRIGQYGKPFMFLKFRSMQAGNDHTIHKEYVTQLIAARNGAAHSQPGKPTVYKLTSDPRITKVGRFLRRTSIDELPQLFNVLLGDMSLVGPRPPVSYEYSAYATWHKNRLLAVKPGITGLWQVAGRSRVTFDEMVRLDLRYASTWSLWLDLCIILQTPRAVLAGHGAY